VKSLLRLVPNGLGSGGKKEGGARVRGAAGKSVRLSCLYTYRRGKMKPGSIEWYQHSAI